MLSISRSGYEISNSLCDENSHLQQYEAPHINTRVNLSARLKAARQHANLRQKELADRVGVNQAVISNIERGIAGSSKRLPEIARACGVSLDWLTLGTGDMVPRRLGVADEAAPYGDDVSPGPAVSGQIPIISYVQAGEFCEAEDPFEPGVADEWLPFRPPGAGPRTYALRVDGESNFPRIRNGEIVIVDPDRAPDSGKFVVAKRHSDEKVTLKQIQFNEGEPYLKPGNPEWPEPIIKIDGDWSVCGVVIGKYDPM